jgi:hypothetical protein
MRPYNGIPGYAGLPYAPHQPPVVSNTQMFYNNPGGDQTTVVSGDASVGADAAAPATYGQGTLLAVLGAGLLLGYLAGSKF